MQPLPIPRLAGRAHGETILRPDGTVVTIGVGVLEVIAALDGQRDFAAVMAQLRAQGSELPEPAVEQVIRHAFEAGILEEPDWTAVPIEAVADSRYRCTSCAQSCRAFRIGPLSDADLGRLAAIDLESLGTTVADAVVTATGIRGEIERYLKKLDDGACIFLDRPSSLCRIHARFGAASKPLVCQVFPARLTLTPKGLRFTVRKSCYSRHSTFRTAPPLCDQLEWIRGLQRLGFGRSTLAFPTWVLCFPASASVELAPGLALAYDDFVLVEAQVLASISGRADTLEAAVVRAIAGVYTTACAALDDNDWPRGTAADPKGCLTRVVTLIKEQGRDLEEPLFHGALDRLLASIGGATGPTPEAFGTGEPELQALAGELFVEDLWSLETLGQGQSYVAAMVLLAIDHLLAKWMALEITLVEGRPRIDCAVFNRASATMGGFLRVLEVRKPVGLLHIAAAPHEVFLGW